MNMLKTSCVDLNILFMYKSNEQRIIINFKMRSKNINQFKLIVEII